MWQLLWVAVEKVDGKLLHIAAKRKWMEMTKMGDAGC
jgi:hypothetical protein